MVQPVVYYQTDPRWRNIPYGVNGEKSTIGTAGCGPTSMAMVLATWADPNVNPETECAWALDNGYKCYHSGTYYSYFPPAAKRYKLRCIQLNYNNIYGDDKSAYHAQAKKAIEENNLVIACMGKGNWTKSGHYVLVYDIQDNTIYINDPASSKPSRTQGDYSLFRQQVKYYWVIDNPANHPFGEEVNYWVEVTSKVPLNCRTFPGAEHPKVTSYAPGTKLHINHRSTGWGFTGDGWVNLKHTKETEDELDMTKEEFIASLTNDEAYEIMSKAIGYLAAKPEPLWSREEGGMAAAKAAGVINDGEPERFLKRDEMAAILLRLGLTQKQ